MKAIKTIAYILTFGFLITNTLVFMNTFVSAYFTPNKSILVSINKYGEANIELALVIILFTISIPTLWFILQDIKKILNKTDRRVIG